MKLASILTHLPILHYTGEYHAGGKTTEIITPKLRRTMVFRGLRCSPATSVVETDLQASEKAPRVFRGMTCSRTSALEGLNLSQRRQATRVFRGIAVGNV